MGGTNPIPFLQLHPLAQDLDTSDEGSAELEVLTLMDKTQQPDLQTGPNWAWKFPLQPFGLLRENVTCGP